MKCVVNGCQLDTKGKAVGGKFFCQDHRIIAVNAVPEMKKKRIPLLQLPSVVKDVSDELVRQGKK